MTEQSTAIFDLCASPTGEPKVSQIPNPSGMAAHSPTGIGTISFVGLVGFIPIAMASGLGIVTVDRIQCLNQQQVSPYIAQQVLPRSVRRMIELIKETFSLTKSSLARVLGVTRPTVYAWLNLDETAMDPTNRQRIDSIYELALEWKRKNIRPMGSLVMVPLRGGKSFVDLISADALDHDQIVDAMNSIASYNKDRGPSPFQTRYAEEMQKQLKRRGFEEPGEELQQLNLEKNSRAAQG